VEKLLASYSLGEIVLFIFLVAVAGKELISIVDWFRDRLKKLYDKDYREKEEHEKLHKTFSYYETLISVVSITLFSVSVMNLISGIICWFFIIKNGTPMSRTRTAITSQEIPRKRRDSGLRSFFAPSQEMAAGVYQNGFL